MLRATDAARRDLAEQPEDGPFGPVLRQFEGRPEEAIAELQRLQAGDAVGALRHPHTGPIDLVWGEAGDGASGYGLAKIIRKHPEVMDDLQGRLSSTTVQSEGPNRVRLTNGRDIFVIRNDFEGDPKKWLLTAYEQNADGAGVTQRSIGRRTGRAGELPEGSSPSAPLHPEDMASRAVDQEADLLPGEAEMQAAIADARAALDADPDLKITVGEGADAMEKSVAELLDDLDQDETLIARMTSCALKGTPR